MDFVNDFTNRICVFVDKKIKEIKTNEGNILNKDIHQRCMNGEIGLRLKQLTWWKEIFFTSVIAFAIILFCINFK